MNFCHLVFKLFMGMAVFANMAFADSVSRSEIKKLNQHGSLSQMKQSLKQVFTTDEDQRLIDQTFAKLRKKAKHWLWRYEAKGDSVAFRVNGKVQLMLKADPSNFDAVYVNGHLLEINRGKSFRSFTNDVEKVLKKSVVKWESLFIQEADAFGLFGAFLVGGLGGYLIGKHQCHARPNCPHRTCHQPAPGVVQQPSVGQPVGTPVVVRRNCRADGRPIFQGISGVGGGNVSKGDVWEIAKNFKFNANCRWPNTGNLKPQCFNNANDCIEFKMGDQRGRRPQTRSNPQRTFGQSWSRAKVAAVCQNVEAQILSCTNGGPAPQPVVLPPPGADPLGAIVPQVCPKTGSGPNARQQQANFCNACNGNLDCCARAGISCQPGQQNTSDVDRVSR